MVTRVPYGMMVGIPLPDKADAFDLRVGVSDAKYLTPKSVFSSLGQVDLDYDEETEIDFSAGTDFILTMTGDTELKIAGGSLSNVVGKKGRIIFLHDNKNITFGSGWCFAGGTPPSLSSGVGSMIDILYYDIVSASLVLGVMIHDVRVP